MIDFYYAPTPNGWKVGIMLEEAGLEYRTHLLNLVGGDQLKPEFLAISPNAKMPAIVDQDAEEPTPVFESGAILLYLADKTGSFRGAPGTPRKAVWEWLFFQAAHVGPMAGQVSHFVNYAPKDQDYSRKRYTGEFERSIQVLENRLDGRDYILGDYSIADMMIFPWVFIAKPLGVDLSRWPRVKDWRGRIKTRPAVQRAIDLHKGVQNHGRNADNAPALFNQDASHLAPKTEPT